MTRNCPKAFFNWSGGKDSALTFYYLQRQGHYDIKYFLTSVNKDFQRISMHGVRIELLKKQAHSLGIPLKLLEVPEKLTLAEYDRLMQNQLTIFKKQGIEHAIFGDIFLEDLKKYREDQLAKVEIQGVFPIWQRPTSQLVKEFLTLGFKAITVCVNEKFLDRSFVGRMMDEQFFKDLPKNVDPCGENGEYHSFVFDGPLFKKAVLFKRGEVVYRRYESSDPTAANQTGTVGAGNVYQDGFWYCDLLPV